VVEVLGVVVPTALNENATFKKNIECVSVFLPHRTTHTGSHRRLKSYTKITSHMRVPQKDRTCWSWRNRAGSHKGPKGTWSYVYTFLKVCSLRTFMTLCAFLFCCRCVFIQETALNLPSHAPGWWKHHFATTMHDSHGWLGGRGLLECSEMLRRSASWPATTASPRIAKRTNLGQHKQS
jgi:hypothetical protein